MIIISQQTSFFHCAICMLMEKNGCSFTGVVWRVNSTQNSEQGHMHLVKMLLQLRNYKPPCCKIVDTCSCNGPFRCTRVTQSLELLLLDNCETFLLNNPRIVSMQKKTFTAINKQWSDTKVVCTKNFTQSPLTLIISNTEKNKNQFEKSDIPTCQIHRKTFKTRIWNWNNQTFSALLNTRQPITTVK